MCIGSAFQQTEVDFQKLYHAFTPLSPQRQKDAPGFPGASVSYARLAAGGIAAAAAVPVIAPAAVAAAAPNDDQQDDDPAAVAAAKTVIAHMGPPKMC